jgi:hydroxyacylglutathione hydrolase
MAGFIYNFQIKRSYGLLPDDQVVAAGPTEIRAIATPGHTAGSMSYLVDESLLFTGDAFKLLDGRVCALRPYVNLDTRMQEESIRKLARLEGVRLACTAHWGCTAAFEAVMRGWK